MNTNLQPILVPPAKIGGRREPFCPPFTPMVTILPKKQESKNFVLEHFTVDKHASLMETIRGIYTAEGDFVRLARKNVHFNAVVMSDTYFERKTNLEVVTKAEGEVLIAGFGIGMILVPILQNPKVSRVTVLEISEEVPEMVMPYLPNKEKLELIITDATQWLPPKGKVWDIVYFDIWDTICTDNLETMKILHKRFAKRKRIWMDSWSKYECLSEKRRDQRYRSYYGR